MTMALYKEGKWGVLTGWYGCVVANHEHHHVLHSLKLQQFAPENEWLEDDRFLFGAPYLTIGVS